MEESLMKKNLLLSIPVALGVLVFAGYLISSEVSNCLYQPSITEPQPGNILFQIYHYTTDSQNCDPYCDHTCSTSDGTIQVSVWQTGNPDVCTHGPYNMSNDGSGTCYTHWSRQVSGIDISDDDYVKFTHINNVGCFVRVNL
jgi:hypothetical protein